MPENNRQRSDTNMLIAEAFTRQAITAASRAAQHRADRMMREMYLEDLTLVIYKAIQAALKNERMNQNVR